MSEVMQGNQHPSKRSRTILKLAFRLTVFSLIGLFWYRYLSQNWASLSEISMQVDWIWIAIAVFLFAAGYALLGMLWSPLLREMNDITISPGQAFRVSALSWVWRYVPGKVWVVASKVYLSAGERSNAAAVSLTVGVETVWSQLTGLLVALVMFPFCARLDFLNVQSRAAIAFAALVGFVLIYPRVFNPLANLVLLRIDQVPLKARPHDRVMLRILSGYAVVFLLWSLGFSAFAASVIDIHVEQLPLLYCIFTFSWTIGVFSFFAPAGLGVRDSLLAFLLTHFLTVEPSIVVALVVGSRLMTTAAEVACVAVAFLLPTVKALVAKPVSSRIV